MAKQFTISASERLKSRKHIESLFSEGIQFSISPLKVFYCFPAIERNKDGKKNGPGLLFGSGVSSRHFRKAVVRNRIKRLMREAWRLNKTGLQQSLVLAGARLHVFIIYTGKSVPDFALISAKMQAVIKKLLKIAHENPAQDT